MQILGGEGVAWRLLFPTIIHFIVLFVLKPFLGPENFDIFLNPARDYFKSILAVLQGKTPKKDPKRNQNRCYLSYQKMYQKATKKRVQNEVPYAPRKWCFTNMKVPLGETCPSMNGKRV